MYGVRGIEGKSVLRTTEIPHQRQLLHIIVSHHFRHEGDKKEEAGYVPLPKFYTFKSRDERERILYKNFVQVGQDEKEMIKGVLNKCVGK